ncbi:MAG: hypothetical protein SNJ79_10950, partial [Sphingomonadaceae bacterium]
RAAAPALHVLCLSPCSLSRWGGWTLTFAVVAVVAFADFVVVADQALITPAAVEPVLDAVEPIRSRVRQAPDEHFNDDVAALEFSAEQLYGFHHGLARHD